MTTILSHINKVIEIQGKYFLLTAIAVTIANLQLQLQYIYLTTSHTYRTRGQTVTQ